MKPIIHFVILAGLVALFGACQSQLPEPIEAVGQPVVIQMPPYPTWDSPPVKGEYPEGGRGSLSPDTRTAIDPDNPLKTNWVEGDKVYIRMTDVNSPSNIATGIATYMAGGTWETNMRWPMDMAKAFFHVYYIGDNTPGGTFAPEATDLLITGTSTSVSAGEQVVLKNFNRIGNRIIFTNVPADDIYTVTGSGFTSNGFNADYTIAYNKLTTTEIPLRAGTNILYLWMEPGDKLLKSASGGSTALPFTNGNEQEGYTFTFDLGQSGSVTPGNMGN